MRLRFLDVKIVFDDSKGIIFGGIVIGQLHHYHNSNIPIYDCKILPLLIPILSPELF